MEPTKPNQNLIYNSILFILAAAGMWLFWQIESSEILKWAVAGLFLVSIWQSFKKEYFSLALLAGFVNSTYLFYLASGEQLAGYIAAAVLFGLIIFLFDYRFLSLKGLNTFGLVSIYNCLIGLVTAELFYVLTFFPIEPKNKGILVVLCLWLYDDLIDSYEQKKLTLQSGTTLTVGFTIIFILLAISFQFEKGF